VAELTDEERETLAALAVDAGFFSRGPEAWQAAVRIVDALKPWLAAREAAAERRGAANALRDAADTAERLRADTYLARVYRDRADRIEAGDA
jgi:hypothetical protein